MRTIKKYANRKLYDTTAKRYLSLKRLADLIRDGEQVEVIDQVTGADITKQTVSRILSQESSASVKEVPTQHLFQLLRRGGDTLADYARRGASIWQYAFTLAEDEIDKLVNRLIKDRGLSKADGLKLKQDIVAYSDSVKHWIGQKIDQRVDETLQVMNLASRSQIAELDEKINQLAQQVEALKENKGRG
jgi:polyhydroxyalkanoate synthesis repressor PhaR